MEETEFQSLSLETQPEETEFKSRSYQTHIEEIAVKENSIVFLPTGSGKTFIAIQLIKRFQKSIQPIYSSGGKRTFFLANTIPLVNQHAKAVGNLTSLAVKGFTSQDKVDLWKIEQWQEQLDTYQVLVMTPQILLDMLLHGYIRLESINFLIFDECHAAIKNHPMRCIMRQFENIPIEKTPRILGLTATLLNSNVKPAEVNASIRELESTFHSKICTCDDLDDVSKYSTNPREFVISFKEYTKNNIDMHAIDVINTIIKVLEENQFPNEGSPKKTLDLEELQSTSKKKKIIKLLKSITRTLEDLGTYCGSLAIMVTIVKLERLKMSADAQTQPYFSYCITILNSARCILEMYMTQDDLYEKINKNCSLKLKTLLNTLKEYSPTYNKKKTVNIHNEKLCCIIFVKERITALTLNCFLKFVMRSDSNFEFLKHDFITGFNVNPFSDTREDLYYKKQNKIIVSNFRLGLLNCLISTDLLEEGFDLPQCNLIIRFDEILTFKSYIQSKGRGRQSTASYVALLPNSKKEVFAKTLQEYQQIFQNINDMLIGKCSFREVPTVNELAKVYEQAYEPYIYKNAKITINSAIALLNRYCAELDHDMYTESKPIWFKKKMEDFFIVIIKMPSNSLLKKPIESPPMKNIKDAKQIAALLACKELHKLGGLNDSLLPANRINDDISVNLLFSLWNEQENLKENSSSYPKNQAFLKKEFPKCFKRQNNSIKSNAFYLHHLDVSPVRESEEPQFSEIYKILDSNRGFSIITKNKLEHLCPFSVYLSSGEVKVDTTHRNIPCTISNELLKEIKRFHVTLFFDILEIKQRFIYLDNVTNDNYYFVVPSYKNGSSIQIDEETIKQTFLILSSIEPSIDERKRLVVKKEDYIHSIVSPWYRSDNSRYVVTEVCDHMTPYSPFGNPDYPTFVDYFYTKHELRLLGNKEQYMLKVRHVGGSNCLMPRSITLANNQNISKKKLKNMSEYFSINPPTYEEILVPEFCVKFDFPGVLWLKAILLPSVLHRITMLSQAEELRQKIASETGLGCIALKDGANWDPLNADIHAIKMSEHSLISQNPEQIDSPETPGTPERSIEAKMVKDRSLESKFAKANIDCEFPWDPKQEPIDIDRNFETVNLIDIECFDSFLGHSVENEEKKTTSNTAPVSSKVSKRAICAPPSIRNEKINILRNTMSETGPQLRSILETLTTSCCNDIINLERLETLGDSFLKFGCSIVLWHKYPKFSEGELTTVKGKLVSNKNLFYCGNKINLGGRMKTKQFNSPYGWLLPAFTVPKCIIDLDNDEKLNTANFVTLDIPRDEVLEGKLSQRTISDITERLTKSSNEELSYSLRDNKMESYIGEVVAKPKWVSDSVEAIIGLYLLEGGIKSAFKILIWFGILPQEDIIENVMNMHVKTPYSENKVLLSDIDFQLDYCQSEIEGILNYKFGDPSYLLQALSHSSNIKNNITECYQRLEFVGDAILDFLITTHIYENYSSLGPGDITDLRSALVNNVTFACLVVRLNLHKYILSSNSVLESAILKFVLNQKQKGDVIDDSVIFLLEEQDCTISEYIDVPKVLGDIFESIAGAIYFDSGNDLQTVWKVFYNFMHTEIVAFSQNIPKQPTRLLYEQIHASPKFLDSVRLENGRIMVPLKFQLLGEKKIVHGFGFNKSNAKRSAAKIALKMLGI